VTEAHPWDDRPCHLGEGALWHPGRGQLFWFDILGRRLLTRDADGPRDWTFDDMPSAAGWIDDDALLVATSTGLWRFDIGTGARERIAPLEAEDPGTRSNDGRTDPQGGFWIGTMGTGAEAGRGAIHRYHRGEVRRLYDRVTIPNSICFAPSGDRAYFADTARRVVMTQRLDRDGWPAGDPEPWLDLSRVGLEPDGAVIDAEGSMWLAQWGAWRVACHGPDGAFRHAVEVSAARVTCPAFGGPDLSTLHVTTARQDLPPDAGPHHALAGRTFTAPVDAVGQAEHRVVL
jgi:sugar lactone lactonase YvrE